MYINTATMEYPLSQYRIRALYPDVSFPSGVIPDATLVEFGIHPVALSEKPSGDVVTEVFPEQINGEWVQAWASRDYTAEEIAARVPKIVTRRQARRALHQMDLLGIVDAAVANASVDVQIEWETAGTIERNHPWVQALGASLALDLDDLFTTAAKL